MSSTDPIKFTVGVGDDDSAYPILIQIEDKEHYVNSFEDADKIVNTLNEQLAREEARHLFEGEIIIKCPFSSGPAYILVKDAETIMTVLDTFVSFHDELDDWVNEYDADDVDYDDEELAEYFSYVDGDETKH